MKTIFTVEDIVDFLATLGYYWDGKIEKGGPCVYKNATIEDLTKTKRNGNYFVSLNVVNFNKNRRKETISFEVSDTIFIEDNYADVHNPIPNSHSYAWREFLLNNHIDTYYSTYVSIYTAKYQRILEHASKKGFIFKKTYLKKYEQEELDKYQKLIENAKKLKEQQSDYGL